jgi:hypothetical protein
MDREQIGVAEAIDRLVSAFDARGWRDDGRAAMVIARAAMARPNTGAAALARSAGRAFMVRNGIGRADLEGVIGRCLRGVVVANVEMSATTSPTVNTVNLFGGVFTGNVGERGTVSGARVQQQQIEGDEAIRAVAASLARRQEVREIVESEDPVAQKRRRLKTVVAAAGAWSSDTVAKVVVGLLKGPGS